MKEVAKEIATRCSHILFHLDVEPEGLMPSLNGWSGGVIVVVHQLFSWDPQPSSEPLLGYFQTKVPTER